MEKEENNISKVLSLPHAQLPTFVHNTYMPINLNFSKKWIDHCIFNHHQEFCSKESTVSLLVSRNLLWRHSLGTCRSWKIPPVGTSFAAITSTGQYSPFSFCSKIWTQNSNFLVTSLHLGNTCSPWEIHFFWKGQGFKYIDIYLIDSRR